MAQTTSELWKTLFSMRNTVREYKFEINGVTYGPDSEVEHSVDSGLYENFGVGNAFNATLKLSLFTEDVEKGATIKRYVRLKNDSQVSEWIPKGIFFVNHRKFDAGYWDIEAYDAMLKAEQVFLSEGDVGGWPRPMPTVVQEICSRMGVDLDSRTTLNQSYMVEYPNDYTMREILGHIAAAHGGNWIVTDSGDLYLIPLVSIPDETNLLVTEHGDAITFGGVRILV